MDVASADAAKRETFDIISFGCLSALEAHEEIESVDFIVNDAIQPHLFHLWQSKNSPYILPGDLKQFYSHFNGLSIQWKVNAGPNRLLTIGHISLNKLEEFIRIPVEGYFTSRKWLDYDIKIDDPRKCAAFIIDSSCRLGDIVLLYSLDSNETVEVSSSPNILKKGYSYPSIWLVDLSQEWHFICLRFEDYLNLMFSHLGIIGWQEAFTSPGLSMTTKIWMNLFCKERLCIDTYHHIAR